MKTEINNEVINTIFNKLAKLFNSFLPGIIILELFFKIGLFSNSPSNIFNFVLYVIWCGIISVMYNSIQPNSVSLFSYIFKKEMFEKYDFDKDADVEELVDDLQEHVTLGFLLLKLSITYILYYIVQLIPLTSFIDIPLNIIQLIVVLILTILISYPIGFLYKAYMKRDFFKSTDEMFLDQ
jgi:hypothetical protein